MLRPSLLLLVLATSLAPIGCRNPCQRICVRMADYAADECGFLVADSELDLCLDAMAESTSDDKPTCRDYGDAETIRNEWACEDLAVYFDGDLPEGEPTSARAVEVAE